MVYQMSWLLWKGLMVQKVEYLEKANYIYFLVGMFDLNIFSPAVYIMRCKVISGRYNKFDSYMYNARTKVSWGCGYNRAGLTCACTMLVSELFRVFSIASGFLITAEETISMCANPEKRRRQISPFSCLKGEKKRNNAR